MHIGHENIIINYCWWLRILLERVINLFFSADFLINLSVSIDLKILFSTYNGGLKFLGVLRPLSFSTPHSIFLFACHIILYYVILCYEIALFSSSNIISRTRSRTIDRLLRARRSIDGKVGGGAGTGGPREGVRGWAECRGIWPWSDRTRRHGVVHRTIARVHRVSAAAYRRPDGPAEGASHRRTICHPVRGRKYAAAAAAVA